MDAPRDPTHDLRRRLAALDIPCPDCDYSLRGLAAPVCPECGRPITLADLREPRRARRRLRLRTAPAINTARIGIAAAIVIAGAHLVEALRWIEPTSRASRIAFPTRPILAAAVCLAGALLCGILLRRAQSSLTTANGDALAWAAATACWLVPIASLLIVR